MAWKQNMEYGSINIAHRMWERTRGKCAIGWKIWEIDIRCWVGRENHWIYYLPVFLLMKQNSNKIAGKKEVEGTMIYFSYLWFYQP